jgi:hypothetical protein
MTDRAQLAAYIAAVLNDEPNGLPCEAIARRLGVRPATVRAVLRADDWFVRTGATRRTRWHVVPNAPGRNGTESETRDVPAAVLRRLDVFEAHVGALAARVDALERRNGFHA